MTVETLTRSQRDSGQRIQDFLGIKVEKAFLQNLSTGETKPFLLNPAELTETYAATYVEHKSLGLSHRRLNYVGSENARIPLTVMFDQLIFSERRGAGNSVTRVGTGAPQTIQPNDVEEWRRFIIAMTYPRRGQRLVTASPSPLLFSWPGMISMRVRLRRVRFRHIQFQSGTVRPRIMVAELDLIEEVMERIFSDQIARQGTFRPWAASNRPRRR